MVIEDNDMDAFIRATLNENQRVRETRNAPVLQAVLSRATTTIAGAPISLSSPVTKMRGDVLGGGTAGGGAFNTIFVETVDPNAGDTYLLGGQVLGGTGSFIIPDIKIIDDESGVLRADGIRMTLKVTGTGVAADGVLLAGFTVTAANIIYTTPTSVTVPTAGSLSGKFCFIDLGVFTPTGFQPTSVGHVNVSFCPSSYNITRF
jgi:hypothetical protein